jgi:eukaryotic-like serine/threonine-protein kinase
MLGAEKLVDPPDERTRIAVGRVGQLVRERWHLDALLGVGGMAAVYAATHRNGKRVAVKMLHPDLSANPEVKQRFVDEGYVANCIKHPGALSVIDDDTTEHGEVFLVMDLLEGVTLEQHLIDCGVLSPVAVLSIADRLLDILAAAHDEGIVHRDVKPDNIFLTREGEVRLLDFGIARLMAPGRSHTTQLGTAIGTPAFMPPEQARGRWDQLDGRTDLWAVGATMFVLLTGRHVREADTVNEELLAAMTLLAPSLREYARHLPKPLTDLVDKALAFERAERWSSAREMQAAVRRVEALLVDEPAAETIGTGAVCPPASPTLVTPSLEPATATKHPPRRRVRHPALILTASAAASFFTLVVGRELVRTMASTADAVAAAPALTVPAATTESEEWTEVANEGDAPLAAGPESPPPTSDPTWTGRAPAPPSKVKVGSNRLRPSRKVSRTPNEARAEELWGLAASGPVPSPPAITPRPDPPAPRVPPPAPADPLDRRK